MNGCGGARPVRLTITMIKWIRTSKLSIKNYLSLGHLTTPRVAWTPQRPLPRIAAASALYRGTSLIRNSLRNSLRGTSLIRNSLEGLGRSMDARPPAPEDRRRFRPVQGYLAHKKFTPP